MNPLLGSLGIALGLVLIVFLIRRVFLDVKEGKQGFWE